MLILFEETFTSFFTFFKDKKSKEVPKKSRNQVFSSFFLLVDEGDPDPYNQITDPDADPEVPKTSGTLLEAS
jgi:hypothetical protein